MNHAIGLHVHIQLGFLWLHEYILLRFRMDFLINSESCKFAFINNKD